MLRLSKNKLVLIILFVVIINTFCIIPYAHAVEETDAANTIQETVQETVQEVDDQLTESVPTTYKTSTISSISALPQANLNLNNILSFILIGIGIVNIILGIAILISSKR